MIVYGWALCQVTWNQTIAEFPALSVGVTYLPLPVGAAVTLLFVIEQFFFGSQMHRPLVRKGDPSSEEVNLGGKPKWTPSLFWAASFYCWPSARRSLTRSVWFR